MLTLGYIPAPRSMDFGEIDTGDIEPVFYSTLKRLERAEKMLWDSFRAAMGVLDGGYPLPQSYVDGHNTACEAVAVQSFDFVAQRNALPGVVIQKPSPFPKIGVVSSTGTTSTAPVSGFGAAGGMVDPGDVRVVMRYPDHEEVVGSVAAGQVVATQAVIENGLGFTWLGFAVVAVIAGVTMTYVICKTIQTTAEYRSKSEVKQAEARRAEAVAAMSKRTHETYNGTLARCAGTSTDLTVIEACVRMATEAVERVNKSVPELPDPLSDGEEGFSVLKTAGLIAIIAVLTVGGMIVYKRWKRRQALQAPTKQDEAPAEA